MDKKVFIRILIGKEEEKLNISKDEWKELEETFERIKPTLDRLGKKECTDEDIKSFIKLIEHNQAVKILADLKKIDEIGNEHNQDEHYYGTIVNNVVGHYIHKWGKK